MPMQHKLLIPNNNLKKLIRDHLKQEHLNKQQFFNNTAKRRAFARAIISFVDKIENQREFIPFKKDNTYLGWIYTTLDFIARSKKLSNLLLEENQYTLEDALKKQHKNIPDNIVSLITTFAQETSDLKFAHDLKYSKNDQQFYQSMMTAVNQNDVDFIREKAGYSTLTKAKQQSACKRSFFSFFMGNHRRARNCCSVFSIKSIIPRL
jgi:hypothetical protein